MSGRRSRRRRPTVRLVELHAEQSFTQRLVGLPRGGKPTRNWARAWGRLYTAYLAAIIGICLAALVLGFLFSR